MVLGLPGARRFLRLLFALRRGMVTLLSFLTALGPVPAHGADWSNQSFANGGGGQAAAQGTASNTNNLASSLSKVSAVLSIAAGGVSMANGAAELKCCTMGCETGAGATSVASELGLDAKANADAKTVEESANKSPPAQRQPIDFRKLRFPDEARNGCPTLPLRSSSPGILFLYELLQPPRAEAVGGCVDGLLALATGGIMLINGIMALKASSQSGKLANIASGNMNNLSSLGANQAGGTSPTPNSSGSSLGSDVGGGTRDQIKIDPSLLRKGTANSILDKFEKKFGIGRDDFAKAVVNGKDPREIFKSAPKNALSNEDMNRAVREANGMTDVAKANALAGTELSQAQKELAEKIGNGAAGDPAYAVSGGGGIGGSTADSMKKRKGEAGQEDLDSLEGKNSISEMPVSPDVQAALDAKESESRRVAQADLSIFEVVHLKYREKSKMIFGFDPDANDGKLRGVGNAEGF